MFKAGDITMIHENSLIGLITSMKEIYDWPIEANYNFIIDVDSETYEDIPSEKSFMFIEVVLDAECYYLAKVIFLGEEKIRSFYLSERAMFKIF